MNYQLNVKVTGNKSAVYHYTVTDESGKVLSERKSNREYVACTINGQYYFGRIDLVGKGQHGRAIRGGYDIPVAYLPKDFSFDELPD